MHLLKTLEPSNPKMAEPQNPKTPQIDPSGETLDDMIWEMIEEEIIMNATGNSPLDRALRVYNQYFPSQREPSSSRKTLKRQRRAAMEDRFRKRRNKPYQHCLVEERETDVEENPKLAMGIVPIQSDAFKLGFVGGEKMAEFIARGLIESRVLPPSRIRAAQLSAPICSAFESFGVTVFEQNHQVVKDCDVVILCVRREIVKDVLLKLRPKLSEKQLLVSVVVGAQLKDLQEWAGHSRLIRVMPNGPAAVREAASVMSLGGAATDEDGELIERLFGAIGKVWRADEKLFDAISGLSHGGAAYTYMAMEAMADGGVASGLPCDLAMGLASQSVLGGASMAVKSGKHPAELKDEVALPGSSAIAGIHELEKAGFRGTLMNAVVASAKRSQDLSQH